VLGFGIEQPFPRMFIKLAHRLNLECDWRSVRLIPGRFQRPLDLFRENHRMQTAAILADGGEIQFRNW
jgi:hypothetical protein